jgi:ATP synthase protein I
VKIRNTTAFHRLAAFRVLVLQSLLTVLVALFCAVIWDATAGYSALLGALIALLSNAYFTHKAFQYFGARSTKAIIQSIWTGEMGKQILAAALFALVFVGVKPLAAGALFAGYILVLGVSAGALLLMRNNPKH